MPHLHFGTDAPLSLPKRDLDELVAPVFCLRYYGFCECEPWVVYIVSDSLAMRDPGAGHEFSIVSLHVMYCTVLSCPIFQSQYYLAITQDSSYILPSVSCGLPTRNRTYTARTQVSSRRTRISCSAALQTTRAMLTQVVWFSRGPFVITVCDPYSTIPRTEPNRIRSRTRGSGYRWVVFR